jgi:3alpha(or 20beta)-hydroxysteroid dehydrogenase
MGRLEGRVVLVTGAARGQGEAEARLFAAEGARVVLGDVLDDAGRAVAHELGEQAVYLRHDVTRPDDWQAAVDLALARFGRLDALVNNAGILVSKPLLEMDVSDYRRVLEVNLVGCFLGVQHAGRALRDGGGGSIVNVSSTAGFQAVPTAAGYVSSKFGIRGLTRTAAVELGPYGIRVNSIHPGGVDTEMSRSFRSREGRAPEPGRPTPHDKLPLGRIGQPIEIARLALFLVSDESSYSTGSEFVADGGMLA